MTGTRPAEISKRFNTTRDAIDRTLRIELRDSIVTNRDGAFLCVFYEDAGFVQ